MQAPQLEQLEQLASKLLITVQRSASKSIVDAPPVDYWRLNQEQRQILRLVLDNQRSVVLKGRQVGSSTVCALLLLGYALCNPGVPVALVADTREKAKNLLGKISDWCSQLGVHWDGNKTSIVLENGAEIDALSAISRAEGSESKVGRSRSYGAIWCSETAFWDNDVAVFRGLTSTALTGARLFVESTASAADNLFRRLWNDDEGDEWARLFLSLEDHAHTYSADPDSIEEETWLSLQESRFGFTNRAVAAWWWAKMRTDFKGDVVGCLREFPVHPQHCFASAEGKWITSTVAADIDMQAPVVAGRTHGWTTYHVEHSEPVIMGVDTGAGLGKDASAIAVVGAHTRRLHATWSSATTAIPAFIEVIKDAAARYKPTKIVVESNYIGVGVYHTLNQLTSLPVKEQVSGAEKHQRLSALKMHIEEGSMPVGPEVLYEVDNSRIAKPTGPRGAPVYVGRDDLLNAISFALSYIDENQPKATVVDVIKKLDPRLVFHRSFLTRKRKECF